MYIVTIIPFAKIPFPAPQTLDYFSSKKADIGAIVQVKISTRKLLGTVVSCELVSQRRQDIKKSTYRLKPVEKIVNPYPVFDRNYLKLIMWISSYYYSPLGLVAKTFSPQVFSKPTEKFIEELSMRCILYNALDGGVSDTPDITRGSNNILGKPVLFWCNDEKIKIRYYAENIKKTLGKNKSILFLVPELYKIEHFQNKIPALKEGITASGKLTRSRQYEIWKKAIKEKQNCVIGTRAALSIHIKNLGLVIVDEEDSDFYKSFDQQPYINARDVAIKLAELTGSKIILGASAPSIGSFWQTKIGKYKLKQSAITSRKSEITTIDMREEIKSKNYSIFSHELQKELKATIEENEQAILFINRRGLATGLLCRDCGHIIKCPNCDVPMVYHKYDNLSHPSQARQLADEGGQPTSSLRTFMPRGITQNLVCHHCGQRNNPPSVCPKCQSYRIKFIGTGTERVKEELDKFFRTNNLKCESAIMDTETVPKWEDQKTVFAKFVDKKYNVLIGTQLMLKPLLLTKVRLASIITIDPILSIPDFRMGERIFKIMDKINSISVSRIFLQTYNPEVPTLKNVLGNFVLSRYENFYNNFLEKELEMRKTLSFPPFSQIIKLSYSHPDSQKTEYEAKALKNKLDTALSMFNVPPFAPAAVGATPRPFEVPKIEGEDGQAPNSMFLILGPAPAFIPREKNRYIWQIMIKSNILDLRLRNKLLRVVPSYWKVDVDPIEML